MRISVPQRMAIDISFEGEEAHLPDYVRDQLHMILREGIRNMLAHSEAEQMAVEVSITPRNRGTYLYTGSRRRFRSRKGGPRGGHRARVDAGTHLTAGGYLRDTL
jgi:hypothetical protein